MRRRTKEPYTSTTRDAELTRAVWTKRRCHEAMGCRSCDDFYRLGHEQLFRTPKTATSRRIVELSPVLLRQLQVVRDSQSVSRQKLGDVYEDHDLVFCQRMAGRFTHTTSSGATFILRPSEPSCRGFAFTIFGTAMRPIYSGRARIPRSFRSVWATARPLSHFPSTATCFQECNATPLGGWRRDS